jgi:SAM-dependent methyltransferase
MEGMRDARGWAELLRENWESFARSPYRDFFVASHRGWDDPEAWRAQADFDAAVVTHELGPERLCELDVLEIGCGVGRLAQVLAPRVRSYTGFDIALPMLEEARARCAGIGEARFFLGDGLGVPAEAADRRYGLAFAQAVFIHCPREVIRDTIASVVDVLATGGEFRFQLRADAADPTGIRPVAEAPIEAKSPRHPQGALTPQELHGLREVEAAVHGRYYMGHPFRHAEVEAFVRAAAPGADVRVLRFGPDDLYVDLRRRARRGRGEQC